MWKVPKLKGLRGNEKVCCGNELLILIFIPWGLNVLWLHADVLVKFPSIVLINYSYVLHKNKSVKQIPTKYQCIFLNKMAPCIHKLQCWILHTEKLRNNKWLHQSNPEMNGNDNFSRKAGLIHIKWSVCVKCKHFQSQHLEIFHVMLWLSLILYLKNTSCRKEKP